MISSAFSNAAWAIGTACLVMTVIVAVRYVLASGLFAWISRKVRPGIYGGLEQQIKAEVRWSLLSAAIFGVPAGLAMWLWRQQGGTQIYTDWDQYPLWYLPVSLLIYLLAHDAWFFWTHRLMHRPTWFKIAHKVHHQSRPPTAWTAMSFHPIEAAVGAIVIPILVLIVPIHAAALITVLTIMTIMGTTNHMGWEIFPRWFVHSGLGSWVITASHHDRHHEDYQCNFGLYFRFWDRLCGTDRGLSERIIKE
ncbi:MAG: sterol desaturase family protein [Erythrobacter sp.]